MKIIFDNIINSLQEAGGISNYWSELSKRMSRYDVDFYGYENSNIFNNKTSRGQERDSILPAKIARYLNFRKKLPKFSVFHSSYYRVTKQKNIVNIITVYDFTYEYYRSGLAKFIHSFQKKRAIKKSNGIICISNNTKKDLLNLYPNIKEDKVKVIYLGVSDCFKVTKEKIDVLNVNFKKLVDKKYILFVGDRRGYKNFDIVVGAVKKIENKILVLVGGNKLSNFEKSILKDLNYEHYMRLSNTNLNILYNNAFCLLYPSSYEGFGMPILEAMSAGCPVVCANSSSSSEVAGMSSILVNKIEVYDFVNAILKLDNKNFRNETIKNGLAQAKKFSWEKCFKETHNFYKEVAGKNFL